MFIKSIALNNFRVYKDVQRLLFEKDEMKNVFIISGNNGYGKTSLLTSLVWCLYGKLMQEVDEEYKVSITELGGYGKYMQSCMNRSAYHDNQREFSVALTFMDVTVPGLHCNELTVARTYNVEAETEKLTLLIDGQENELVQEVGKEIFIHDFVLPKEVAKFFFFDAEKAVSLAATQSLSDKATLSKAYSEILGIKKYEDLRANLSDMRLRYRKQSAVGSERMRISELEKELNILTRQREAAEEKLADLAEQKAEAQRRAGRAQEKLIREGSVLNLDQVTAMRSRQKALAKEYEGLKTDFSELLDLAPFAIAGGLMRDVEQQLNKEEVKRSGTLSVELLEEKIAAIKDGLSNTAKNFSSVNDKLKKLYESTIEALLREHLGAGIANQLTTPSLDLAKEEASHFRGIMQNLRSSYQVRLADVNRRIKNNRYEYNKLLSSLADAESKDADALITVFRKEKEEAEKALSETEAQTYEELKALGSYENQYSTKRKLLEELAKKMTVSEKFSAKDTLAEQLLADLDAFLAAIREEKGKALEARILSGLQSLMHKEKLVTGVRVHFERNLMDVELYHNKEKILKENLSKGEQQLYATALLKALVEESNIRFPVFIDSPMQKYDRQHAANVIKEFYPSISEQVVLFPLLEKEMTKEEYSLLLPHVNSVYKIVNQGSSFFEKVAAKALFEREKLTLTHDFAN